MIFYLYIASMMVPVQVTLVPLFLIMTSLGFKTRIGLILPAIAGPFGVFLMKQFISTLPTELIKRRSLTLRRVQTFGRVILPLAKPGLAVLGSLPHGAVESVPVAFDHYKFS